MNNKQLLMIDLVALRYIELKGQLPRLLLNDFLRFIDRVLMRSSSHVIVHDLAKHLFNFNISSLKAFLSAEALAQQDSLEDLAASFNKAKA